MEFGRFDILFQHWGYKFDPERDGWGAIRHEEWDSADLLTKYQVQLHFNKKRGRNRKLVGATATRTVCQAVEPPYPLDTPIGCKIVLSKFNVDKKHPDASATWTGKPEAIAWSALAEAARRSKIKLLPDLALQKCEKPTTVEGKQLTSCDFAEPTAMQSLQVDLTRRRPILGLTKNVPWTLSGVGGVSCSAEAAHNTNQ